MVEAIGAEDLVHALKAAGDPSRLRILALVDQHELTVSELVTILGQSQPRVSRHLRVLVDAGLLRRQTEGTSAYYRTDRTRAQSNVVSVVLDSLDQSDPEIARDLSRLQVIREQRATRAARYFEEIAASWDKMRSRHVPEAEIEAALIAALEPRGANTLVDLGTGTGRILEIAAPHISVGIGIDSSRDMLAVARDKLEQKQLHHCRVRRGDVYNLDLHRGTVDAAVLHHVLHFLDEPQRAIEEASHLLGPDGLLMIVDFAPHEVQELRDEYQHRRLGFAHSEIEAWCREAGLVDVRSQTFVPDRSDDNALAVTLWTAVQRADARTTTELEVA